MSHCGCSVWDHAGEHGERSDASSLAWTVMRLQRKNEKLKQAISDFKRREKQRTQRMGLEVDQHSVSVQTDGSFLQQQVNHAQQVVLMQDRLDRVISLQERTSARYERELKRTKHLQEANKELAVQVISLEKQLVETQAKLSSIRSHRTHGTKRGKDVFTVTEELDALQAKHTETLQRLAVAEDRNQRLVEVVEQSKLKLKRLKSQADSLSPELIKELEDMRFALYQSQHMNSAYEKALRQLTRNLRLPYPKKQLAAMYATEGSDLSS
eukprot:m.234343 g.234343  ORF g.234343 m.234343 type:complete len:268 (+) comp15256_c1_seq3:128-931(+)